MKVGIAPKSFDHFCYADLTATYTGVVRELRKLLKQKDAPRYIGFAVENTTYLYDAEKAENPIYTGDDEKKMRQVCHVVYEVRSFAKTKKKHLRAAVVGRAARQFYAMRWCFPSYEHEIFDQAELDRNVARSRSAQEAAEHARAGTDDSASPF